MNGADWSPDTLPETAFFWLAQLRQERPRVHCITNAAAQVFTANLLLAAGAIPSLTIAAEEVPFFTRRAQALLVNLGTLDHERRAAIPVALHAAREAQRPWVLDPVFVEASPPRLAWARELLAQRPSILRCNGPEFEALAEQAATHDALRALSDAQGCVVALTGPIDRIVAGSHTLSIANGHPLMARTTAMGCAGTALIAAFAGLGASPFIAAASALLLLGIAGECAGEACEGPGSFVPAFLDRLAALDLATLQTRARIAA